MITDEQLEKRAEELARHQFETLSSPSPSDIGMRWIDSTLDRLRDARESLRLLEQSQCANVFCIGGAIPTMPDGEPEPCRECFERDANIAHLKKLLGA